MVCVESIGIAVTISYLYASSSLEISLVCELLSWAIDRLRGVDAC